MYIPIIWRFWTYGSYDLDGFSGNFVESTKLVSNVNISPADERLLSVLREDARASTAQIARRFESLGGQATLRLKDGQPLVTDNGQHILDVKGLAITDPLAFESGVNQWPGVVTVGVFAHQKASVCLLGTAQGVKTLDY